MKRRIANLVGANFPIPYFEEIKRVSGPLNCRVHASIDELVRTGFRRIRIQVRHCPKWPHIYELNAQGIT